MARWWASVARRKLAAHQRPAAGLVGRLLGHHPLPQLRPSQQVQVQPAQPFPGLLHPLLVAVLGKQLARVPRGRPRALARIAGTERALGFGLGRELRPQRVDRLLPVQAVAGREGEQLDEVAGAALPPGGVRDTALAHADREATQQQHLHTIHRRSILRTQGWLKRFVRTAWREDLPGTFPDERSNHA
jgi:hypothetical protein